MRFLAILAALVLATPVAAQETERWPYPPGTVEAFHAGNFARAQALLEAAVSRCEASRSRGNACLDLLIALGNMASEAGDRRRALAFRERVLPADHPEIAGSYNNLASNLYAHGRYGDAEPLLLKALTIREKSFLKSHLNHIDSNLALASALQRQSKSPATSRSLYREAERGVQERVASFASFDRAAQEEIRKYRPIFTGQVEVAWQLAQQAEAAQ